MDLYSTLNIQRTATQKEIKLAYYKLTQLYHPDKETADDTKYKEVVFAYEILSDEDRKEHYDRTGETEEKIDSKWSEMLGFFTECLLKGESDPHKYSIGHFNGKIKDCDKQILISIEKKDKIVRAIKKLEKNNKGDEKGLLILKGALTSVCESIEGYIEQQKKEIQDCKDSIELLNTFKFPADKPSFPIPQIDWGNSFTQGFSGVTPEMREEAHRNVEKVKQEIRARAEAARERMREHARKLAEQAEKEAKDRIERKEPKVVVKGDSTEVAKKFQELNSKLEIDPEDGFDDKRHTFIIDDPQSVSAFKNSLSQDTIWIPIEERQIPQPQPIGPGHPMDSSWLDNPHPTKLPPQPIKTKIKLSEEEKKALKNPTKKIEGGKQ